MNTLRAASLLPAVPHGLSWVASLCLPGTLSWGPGLLMGSPWSPKTLSKKWSLNANHRETFFFSRILSCGTKTGDLNRKDKQKGEKRHRARLAVPVISALGRWKQEYQEFKVILGNILSSRLSWATWDLVSISMPQKSLKEKRNVCTLLLTTHVWLPLT